MTNIYIVAGCRTPIGSFLGQFEKHSSVELGSIVIEECIKRSNLNNSDIDQVIIGQILTTGQGPNPARQSSIKASIPIEVPAFTINMLCGSGLKAVYLAWQLIKCGDANIVVAGGQESMSRAQHSVYVRSGNKYGGLNLSDTVQGDCLVDAFHNVSMGLTAEFVASKYNVSRNAQDKFALESQKKTQQAIENGYFKTEIVPVIDKKTKKEILVDEFPKLNCTLEGLEKLRAAFKDNGTVTAGNASGINDGAAALILCSEETVKSKNLTPLVKVVAFAEAGVEPMEMGLGPIPAVQKLLEKTGWSKDDVDLYELNEAFAAQSIVVVEQLGVDMNKVNVTGGAVALGHPVGSSGARCLVTLIYNLIRLNKKKGVAALCIGGGMGIAIAVERC